MVIFYYAAVYKYHKRLFKNIQKRKKMQRSTQFTHSTFTQLHFPQTDLRHPQKNFAVLFCSQFTLTWLCFWFLVPSTTEFC